MKRMRNGLLRNELGGFVFSDRMATDQFEAEKTEVMALMGETITGHQKGRPRQPSDSAPFWRIMRRTGMFWAC